MLHRSFIPVIHADESPASACSRVAIMVGRTARDFCADMGFTFGGIVEGRQDDLDAFARVARLVAGFPGLAVVGSGHMFRIGCEAFTRDTLSRQRLRVCPHCIAEDLATGAGPVETRPYGRTIWLVEAIRTCPKHRCALVVASQDGRPGLVHDFARLLAGAAATAEAAPIGSRSLSAYEARVLSRLTDNCADEGWLAHLPAYAMCKISETIGAASEFGPRFRTKDLTDEDWYRVGDVGFKIADAGEAGIAPFLDGLRARFDDTRHPWGGRQVFGRIYEWLAHENEDTAYDPLRAIVRNYVVRNLPIGPGEEYLGKPVERRYKHSIHSLHKETGTHPTRLRKLLLASGVIDAASAGSSDERVVFDADAIVDVREEVTGTLTLKGAAAHLNAPRPQERIILKAGIIKPSGKGSKRGTLRDVFSVADLNRFLEDLLQDASPATPSDGEVHQIPTAARRANCSSSEVVRLLLDRRLKTVRLDPAERGYLSVLVDPQEVRPLVRGDEHGGISLRDVTRRLGTSNYVVKALTEFGHLPSRRAINPTNRCPQTVVNEGDLQAFDERYVSLRALARASGMRGTLLKARLEWSGVDPAFDPDAVGLPFFERAKCQLALSTMVAKR